MAGIPATQEKLDEARTCLERLQVSGQALPLDQAEFNDRLSAFLSAAYSVVDVLKTESGKTAKGWVKQWWGCRATQDQALHGFMRDQRDAELHRRGAALHFDTKSISSVAYLSRVRECQIRVTGPVEAAMPGEIPIDVPMLGDEEATARCTRYFSLLEQMVRDFLGAHQHP